MEETGGKALGSGYYWIGTRQLVDGLQRNPYLLVDGDEALLFDPGPPQDFEELSSALASIVPPEKLAYVVVHDGSPDLSAGLSAMEAAGMRFRLVAHWRSWALLRFKGLKSPPYLVDEHGNALQLKSGRRLQFISTPHLPSAGSFATYDRSAKVLLSGDLFGAFRHAWSLGADEHYLEGMKAFHEHFMPSNEILRPVMNFLGSLDIAMVLPRRGAVIAGDVGRYIGELAELDCGRLLGPMAPTGRTPGDLEPPLNRLMKRIAALFGAEKAETMAAKAGLRWDAASERLLGDFGQGTILWDKLLDALLADEGRLSLALMEPFIAALCGEFSLPRPGAYEILKPRSAGDALDLGAEIAKLREMNEQLMRSAALAQKNLMVDAVTGLSNESYFRGFIEEEAPLRLYSQDMEDDVLAVIGVDEGMARIEYQYGPKEVEAILRGIARIVQDLMKKNMAAFRLHGASFALWMPYTLFHEANDLCEEIRTRVDASKAFIEHVTVSIGLAALADIRDKVDPAEAGSTLVELGTRRLREAKKRGGNSLCSVSEFSKEAEVKAKILIVDDDAVNADVVKTFLENADYVVVEAKDGDEALKLISQEGFDLIISELMIPKLDGFMLKESLARRSGTKDIPFILFSHLKDETTVVRSYALGIDYYLRKPFLLSELLGMVQRILASGTVR